MKTIKELLETIDNGVNVFIYKSFGRHISGDEITPHWSFVSGMQNIDNEILESTYFRTKMYKIANVSTLNIFLAI